ncbi:hypothetical protein BC343_16710 [Mucilaginibacter pedocola]|uniref:Uncharacterized protein n=1 Tax=Mucilaginibacter pedocola TaxID=1792845 RepID=A0A1S9P875_9SPHI|nr:hypothetical protein BC343_16710 [Mucilaginibacter pedocola]
MALYFIFQHINTHLLCKQKCRAELGIRLAPLVYFASVYLCCFSRHGNVAANFQFAQKGILYLSFGAGFFFRLGH